MPQKTWNMNLSVAELYSGATGAREQALSVRKAVQALRSILPRRYCLENVCRVTN